MLNQIKLAAFAVLIAGTASAAEGPDRHGTHDAPDSRPGYGKHYAPGYGPGHAKHYAPGYGPNAPGYGPSDRHAPGDRDYNSPPTDEGGGRLNYGPLGGNGGS